MEIVRKLYTQKKNVIEKRKERFIGDKNLKIIASNQFFRVNDIWKFIYWLLLLSSHQKG